jgi:hypothetical protein
MPGQNLFSQQIIIFFDKNIIDMSFLILNKYWECHEITEYLNIYSWRQVNMLNKWRVFNGDVEYVVAF